MSRHPQIACRARRAGIVSLLLMVLACGCSRSFYRAQADLEVYGLVGAASKDPRWPLSGYTIEINPRSRLYDPYAPDFPPMTPDDPSAHQLMHVVDGKAGFPCWHQNGDVPDVDDEAWRAYLPTSADGKSTLDHDAAVLMALLHSREYQQNLENLYLSALDVSFERFRFDAQFFGGNSTFYEANGRLRGGNESLSILRETNDLQMRKLFATGGTLVADVANSLVWQFSGPNTYNANTLLDFTFLQPLLRAGSRAPVLERLTIVERALLYNIRTMELYRRGFYVDTLTGTGAGQGPQRRGGVFGGSGLQNFAGVGGGGFGRIGTATNVAGGGGGGVTATGAGANRAGGYIGLLQQELEIQNQESNVASLRDSLAQLEAAYDAGRIDRFQVDLARQNLYQVQSALLNNKANYELTLDNFKIDLGLPPQLELTLKDTMLDSFRLIDPRLTDIQISAGDLLDDLRDPTIDSTWDSAHKLLEEAVETVEEGANHISVVQTDFETFQANLSPRRRSLEALKDERRSFRGDLEPSAYDIQQLEMRFGSLKNDFGDFRSRFDKTAAEIRAVNPEEFPDPEALRDRLLGLATHLSAELAELVLLQARARLDSAVLTKIEISAATAYRVASQNRLDWMNARGSLVDSWRLVQLNANNLKGDLNVVFSGDVTTTDNNPLRFRGVTGGLRVGLEFDAPLTRINERNLYRQSLIEYEQARRGYMSFRDRISFILRNRVRQIELYQLNFEIRRAAVLVAISQVEQTRLRLDQPPRPGETSMLGNTTTRDLVDALRSLVDAQNDFLSVWVSFEVQRMGLDYDLGTMQLDSRGLWVDPGEIVYKDDDPSLQGAGCDDLRLIPPGLDSMLNRSLDDEDAEGEGVPAPEPRVPQTDRAPEPDFANPETLPTTP